MRMSWARRLSAGAMLIVLSLAPAIAGAQTYPSPRFAGVAGVLVPGAGANIAASLATAGTSVTVSADSFVVCTALNGTCYDLPSYSQTFNGATTGAGGMDTGSLPSSGFVALYAIYNPSTSTASILGYNCASSCGTIYPGSNLPSGYTASALLAIWPTNSTPDLIVAYVKGRTISFANIIVLQSSSTSVSSFTSLSLSTIVPPSAKTVSGNLAVETGSSASAGRTYIEVASDSNGNGLQLAGNYSSTSSIFAYVGIFINLMLPTPQTLWYELGNIGTSPTSYIEVTGYSW